MSRFPQGVVNLQLPDVLFYTAVLSGDFGCPASRFFTKRSGGRIMFRGHMIDGIAITRFEFVLHVLLENGIVQIQTLQIVLSGQLLRLISNDAERILHGGTRQQFRSAHEHQVFGDFVENIAFHRGHGELQVHYEVSILVGVRRRQTQKIIVSSAAGFFFELFSFRGDFRAVLLQRRYGLKEGTFLLFESVDTKQWLKQ